ncbi:hypothetical protein K493DRAFT_409572 [Basidiobolus meristosporus CBS 931.73]|uniref:DDHD domain-containing protein n=1 Tax=Basidiobolus meristosporus CBS 931.73 TaxID=1314790 RepID=A0A1Y1XZU0_9FUNG|nr:hypothetical protein K493DRAFT_409572 [Basidiobolus meristosporus CBS 931.73]|eukprot:ORX90986.1 hypothetical protein K493DRAFT_409572 [Basidiobolus meristosporus CBS 931.73]
MIAQVSPTNETHVMFVVHGIGPTYEGEHTFTENVTGFRKAFRKVSKHERSLRDVNVELIPIEWHTSLHKLVNNNMDNITPKYCPPNVKNLQHEYLADILYYFTQDRGQHIVDTVANSMNEEYDRYMKEHPDYNGKFSLIGYSLGGICCYDILCGQEDAANAKGRAKFNIHVPKLKFKPSFFFSMGSPIAAVMVMRNQTFDQYKVPDYCIHHNIFHPYDPFAYRMEPMIDEKYRELTPNVLPIFSSPRFNLNNRLSFGSFLPPKVKSPSLPVPHISIAATFASLLSRVGSQNKDFDDHISSTQMAHVEEQVNNDSSTDEEIIADIPRSASPESFESTDTPEHIIHSEEPYLPPLKYRIDYSLHERIRIDNVAQRYMLTLKAHFSYWEHRDVARHILETVHQGFDAELSLPVNQSVC